MGKSDTHILNFKRPTPSRSHTIATALLLVLCIPTFVYHLVPAFIHTADDLTSTLVMRIRGHASRADFCTKEVGRVHCCGLFLDASPCVDECRKQFLDRVAFRITEEYDECADVCLSQYNASCSRADDGISLESTRKGN
jgi:hypothetical protein